MSIKVSDDYRKNELSLHPGGSEIKVTYQNGKVLIYDKIKSVKQYCKKLLHDKTIIEIVVDNQVYFTLNNK
jgi:hypothetical protein